MRARDGFVLAAALLALMLIAALVAGVFLASSEATRMAVAAGDRQLALMTAESVAGRMLAEWSPESAPSETGATTSSSFEENGIPATVYLTRLDSTLFWVVSSAGPVRPGSGITARIGVVLALKNAADGSTSVDRIAERWWSELF